MQPDENYTDEQILIDILGFAHQRPSPARRELINRKILQRSPDGKVYWKVEAKGIDG